MKLTTEELREMRERCEKARKDDVYTCEECGLSEEDRITSRTDMPRLLDAYEALERENERLCEALRYADRAAKYGIAYDAEYVANALEGGTRDAVDSE